VVLRLMQGVLQQGSAMAVFGLVVVLRPILGPVPE
jgi:hypothetical protein